MPDGELMQYYLTFDPAEPDGTPDNGHDTWNGNGHDPWASPGRGG
jgi:hypothetical protein